MALDRVIRCMSTFRKSEDGSFAIEAVIWTPIFAMMLAIMINLSMIFFNESQVLRVVQDGNRAFSLGRLATTEEAENYIKANLAYLSSAFTVETTEESGKVATTVSIAATELMPMNFMRGSFKDLTLEISGQQLIEF